MDNQSEKKMAEDFVSIQKTFFKDVLKDYVAPFKSVWLFLSIPLELVRHFIINMSMDEEEHLMYNDMKYKNEIKDLMKKSTSEKELTE